MAVLRMGFLVKWVIVRVEDGRFVASAGSRSSYVVCLQHARAFDTKKAAEREACENERVLSLEQAMERRT